MRNALLWLALAPAILILALHPDAAAQARVDSVARRDSISSLEAVTVSAIRARNEAPVSSKTMSAVELDRQSFGQDIPLLLQRTPSLTSYSETGSYWGYSYLRLRGIDQSRINLTIDGIPLNDPEDQVLYFADFPDLANSVTSIQIQRGVATSAPGTASYGGSINFQTVPLIEAPRSAELQLQGGSFGSTRASAEYTTGILGNRVAAYGRLSALRSNGYRYHSGMEGRSGFLSAAYFGARDMLKLTALAGLFADTLSYVGAPRDSLARDRRFNPLRPDEVDRFGEQLVALTYTRALRSGTSLSATAYRLSAGGDYDVCIAQCDQPQGDLWNFNLDFEWYGGTAVWTVERDRLRGSVGLNANTYERDHHAYSRQPLTRLYLNTGHKDDASAFAKLAYEVGDVTLFGDVQGRRATFGYTPDANAGIPPASIAWRFVNPKVGATWRASPSVSAYTSFGMNSREPARSDMFGGFDNLDTTNAAFVGPLTRVRPERAHDTEAGVHFRSSRLTVDANVFAMEFRDEILPVGRLSYIGTPLRANVPSSWRRGLEGDVSWRPASALEIGLTATAMRARIARFTDDETGQAYRDVEPLLTPRLTAAQQITLRPTGAFEMTARTRYVGRSQLDNTGDPGRTLPSYQVVDLDATWKAGASEVTLHVNNLFDHHGFASGHVSYGEPRYYVLPPFSVFLLVRLAN